MTRYSAGWIFAIVVLCAAITGCTGNIISPGPSVPGHTDAWLSYKYGFNCGSYSFPNLADPSTLQASANCPGLSDGVEAGNYYSDIGAPADFPTWLRTYGFPPTGTNAEAFYGNFLDLRFGRDMNCSQTGQQIACYVTNYGPLASDCTAASGGIQCPWPDLETGVDDAIGQATLGPHAPFATVAMVWNGTPNTPSSLPPNNITFYVYKADGSRLNFAALDDEGFKSVPRMCMACHGGSYSPHTGTASASVTGTSFLPFDVHSFYYSKLHQDTKGVDQQQEAFRILNSLVKTTNGGDQAISAQTPQQAAIVEFINGQYCPDLVNGGILNPCSTPVEKALSPAISGYFPVGWKNQQKAYSEAIKPYCRMCHMAQIPTFLSSGDLSGVQNLVCSLKDMPHAEVPFGGGSNAAVNPFIQQSDLTTHFWLDGTAVSDLQAAAGISSCQ